jgi:Na+/citrate or Na+/malate symporter
MEGLTIEPITKLKPLIRVADEKEEKKSYLYTLGKAKVGVIPLPLYLVIAFIIYSAGVYNQLPAE